MSRPVLPTCLYVYKVIREYEKTGRTLYSKKELLDFANKALVIATAIDNEDYWLCPDTEKGYLHEEAMSRICDVTTNYLEVNEQKYNKGGKDWAEKRIGLMQYSFLKGALKVLNEELNENKNEGILCD